MLLRSVQKFDILRVVLGGYDDQVQRGMRDMSRVVFIGSKHLGLNCLKRIHELAPSSLAGVVTIDDSSDTRTVFDQFQSFGDANAVRVEVAKHRRDSERLICSLEPDICLVVGWYWLITKDTLNKVPRGFLGIHNSLLPKYRGAAPLVWAIINGDSELGFSLFSFADSMDDGPVWGQRTVSLQDDDYIGDVLQRLKDEAMVFLTDIWPSILEGSVVPIPQDQSEATFCSFRTPEDGEIDWKRPAREIYNFIRAQSAPYPGAYTSIDGTTKLTVWRAKPVDLCFYGTPGQVAQLQHNGVYVICGDNRPLLLEEVSIAGDGMAPAQDVLKSLKQRLSPMIR
ncbi:MAG: methionyl-tRNA formyltransferase [Planctomycetaceae bacterium]